MEETTNNIKITSEQSGITRIFMNGEELKWVTKVELLIGAKKPNIVKIEQIVDDVDIETPNCKIIKTPARLLDNPKIIKTRNELTYREKHN